MSDPIKRLRLANVKVKPRKRSKPKRRGPVKGDSKSAFSPMAVLREGDAAPVTVKPLIDRIAAYDLGHELPPPFAPLGDSPNPLRGAVTRVRDWCITGPDCFMVQPETPNAHLLGYVINHRIHPDGESVRSSQIQGKRGDHVITYTGSEYELGAPLEAYVALFGPDPKTKLLAGLKEVVS